MSGGTLNLTSTTTRSSARTLALSGGTLTGPGALDIADDFDWTGGSMTGTGQTTLAQGGEGTIATTPSLWLTLDQRLLINHGETTWSGGSIRGLNGAAITNTGTFHANSEATDGLQSFSGDPSVFRNTVTGTFEKTSGNGTANVGFQFDNANDVLAQAGELRFSGGGIPYQSGPLMNDPLLCPTPRNAQQGSWSSDVGANASISFASSSCVALGNGTDLSGAVAVKGATVLAGALQGAGALVYVDGGTLAFEEPAVASVLQSLYLAGTVTGPGELDVCGNLTWQAGTMSGTGKTVLCPGNIATIGAPTAGSVTLDRRWLVNRGDLTWATGSVIGRTGAIISNWGVFHANSESGDMTVDASAGLAAIVNHGELRKDAGTTVTDVCFQFNQQGAVSEVTGRMSFCGDWNQEPRLQADLPKCTLRGITGGLAPPDSEEAPIILAGQVICTDEVDRIQLRWMIDGVEMLSDDDGASPAEAGWVCTDTDLCPPTGPAFYIGRLPNPLGTRTCVPYVIYAAVLGGEEPAPARGMACLPGSEQP